jgi:hypothetical protein
MSEPKSEEAASYRPRWYKLFMTWQIIHWTLLVLVTGGSAAVASAAIGTTNKDPLALAVAVVGAIYAALNPGQRAEAYREAWFILNAAVLNGDEGKAIVDAYKRGEEIIGRRPTPSPTDAKP